MPLTDRTWFAREALAVAPDLLGAVLVHRTSSGTVAVRISEVEAYDGANDPGSHAFRGRTARNATMFGEPGQLYVYRHLGLHYCANIVCAPAGRAAAVLLRAGAVVAGADVAFARRRAAGVCRSERDLARGPARLTVALGISYADDGAGLLMPRASGLLAPAADGFSLLIPPPRQQKFRIISTGPRVGVAGEGGRGDLYPWRFWLTDDPTVSAYRPAQPRKRPTA